MVARAPSPARRKAIVAETAARPTQEQGEEGVNKLAAFRDTLPEDQTRPAASSARLYHLPACGGGRRRASRRTMRARRICTRNVRSLIWTKLKRHAQCLCRAPNGRSC